MVRIRPLFPFFSTKTDNLKISVISEKIDPIRTNVFYYLLDICAHYDISKNFIGWVAFKSLII
jgi:hypothetical protein